MKYICYKRYTGNSLSGKVNIPAMSECEELNNLIIWKDKIICYATSEVAHTYFCINNDNNGLLRGKLICRINHLLKSHDEHYQYIWDKVWQDSKCRQFKRSDSGDQWLWNHLFYNADIESLLYIARLIGIKEKDL